jgi:general secretion pathway protein I
MTTHKHSSQSGFTLIETLVAFAILGLASGVVMSILSKNPIKVVHIENQRRATLVAQSLLAGVGTEYELNPGVQHGKMPDGAEWSLTIEKHGDEAGSDQDNKTSTVTIPYLVMAGVTYGMGGTAASATITSLRLVTAQP